MWMFDILLVYGLMGIGWGLPGGGIGGVIGLYEHYVVLYKMGYVIRRWERDQERCKKLLVVVFKQYLV